MRDSRPLDSVSGRGFCAPRSKTALKTHFCRRVSRRRVVLYDRIQVDGYFYVNRGSKHPSACMQHSRVYMKIRYFPRCRRCVAEVRVVFFGFNADNAGVVYFREYKIASTSSGCPEFLQVFPGNGESGLPFRCVHL